MGDYNRNDRSGRGGSRYGGGGGGRDFGRREMHRATCAQCGKDCEVPFMPSGGRPVYCSDCFEKRRNDDGGDSRGSGGRNYDRPRYEERQSYSPDRGDRGGSRGNDNGQIIDQLKSLNFKLDKVISILDPKSMKPVPKKEVSEVVFEPKAIQPKAVKDKALKKKVPPKKGKEEKVLVDTSELISDPVVE